MKRYPRGFLPEMRTAVSQSSSSDTAKDSFGVIFIFDAEDRMIAIRNRADLMSVANCYLT